MSRKHSHAYAAFQRGKGLVGFLAGLVLATMIIIAVLLMLNSNSKRDFQNTSPATTTPPTDTLQPAGVQNTPASPIAVADNTQPVEEQNPPAVVASDVAPLPASPVAETVPETPHTPNNTAETDNTYTEAEDTTQPIDKKEELDNLDVRETPPEAETPPVVSKPPRTNNNFGRDGVPEGVRPNHNRDGKRGSTNTGTLRPEDLQDPPKTKPPVRTQQPTTVPPVKPTEPKKVEPTPVVKPKPAETKPAEKPKTTPPKPADKPKTVAPKPTPQQILDAGNIDKARELARRQAAAPKPAPAPTAKAADTKRVVIQAGAYSSRNAADAQRARLALLGVKAQIVEANVNGKPTYRVQTNRLEGAQVSQTRNLLQKNGVSTLERSAD
ncbi:SPOR domain-containing protein [Alysiella crassa]|uniref:Uncharacterized protein conserved in bacteria n=1 Tax=Alysiella crassa TaxID=153491 RepID=A0A376BXN3_9NEIS|nr:SPOR domain-containing protein [Alysiella crassa]UOP06560.1 SPOR domain-containing protein [Alysiella crassa]SSY81094.1 Uncharacterized protein conserved in bacteria [Alysiella crassa]